MSLKPVLQKNVRGVTGGEGGVYKHNSIWGRVGQKYFNLFLLNLPVFFKKLHVMYSS